MIPVAVVNGDLTVDRHQKSVASLVMQKVLPQELINPEICLTKRFLLENLKVHRRKLQMFIVLFGPTLAAMCTCVLLSKKKLSTIASKNCNALFF